RFFFSFPTPSPSVISPLSLHDALPICDLQRLAAVPAAAALFASHVHVRQEMHFHLDDAIASTRLAPAAFDVETEPARTVPAHLRSEEHTSELQSRFDLVCRLLLEKKKK